MTTILEVAIGLFFIFLLFSLLVSAVNEAVFGHLTHLRSRVLEDSLHAILSKQAKGFSVWAWLRRGFKAPARSIADAFSDDLLKHPLVQGLVVGNQRCPHYLPAETFVDATLGTLLKLGTASASPALSSQLDKVTVSDLAAAVNGLSDDHAKRVFSSVLAGATSLDDARQKLEAWFNNSMERVSGIYKRYSQFWLYIWAGVIAVWLNVDTIEVTRRLLADAQFRSTLATGAVNFMNQANATNSPVGTGTGTAPSSAAPSSNLPPSQTVFGVVLSPADLLQEISQLSLPLGWGACSNNVGANSIIGWVITKLPKLEQSAVVAGTNSAVYSLTSGALAAAAPCPNTPAAWRLKLLGLIITIAAISQGAPFWFDLLNRVTNLRAAGRPPESKRDGG